MSGGPLVFSLGHSGVEGSGLYVYDGERVEAIDVLPSGGLARDRGLIYRMAALTQDFGAEMLVYDRTGVVRYERYAAVSAPHDVLARDDGSVLAVSTRDNAIVELARDGSVRDVFRADAPPDAWHLNCITMHGGRLFATAFGRFATHRAWYGNWRNNGMLFDVASGEDVLTGLTAPHSPQRDGDAWLVCDSGTESVLRVRDGRAPERIDVGGFCRSFCIAGERVYVGVSRMRDGALTAGTGWISVLDREAWRETGRIPVPCGAMYDVIEADDDLVAGLRTGFGRTSQSERYLGGMALFEQAGTAPRRVWAVGEAVAPSDCRARIDGVLPRRMGLRDIAEFDVTVENAGNAVFAPAPPHAVEVCYRWFDGDGTALGAGTWLHTALPRVLTGGDRVTVRMPVAAPPSTGTFTLRVTLLQEGLQWFDDVAPESALSGTVEIGEVTVPPSNR